MHEEKVSIIIPIYNVEKYITECVESIKKQKYKNIEIILIDDGSKDNSSKVCDNLAKKYNNIIVKHVKNGGVSKARNIGLSLATGKYVMFIDGDDYIEDTMVYELVKKIKESQSELVACNYKFCYMNKTKDASFVVKDTYSKKEAKIELLKNTSIRGFTCNKIFINKIIKENNITFDENIKICEDLLFCFKYIEKITKLATINKPLYNYRMRKSSASNSGIEKDLSVFIAYNEMYKIDKKIYAYNEDFYAYLYFKYYKELKKNNILNQVNRLNLLQSLINKKIKFKTKIYILIYIILPNKIRKNISKTKKQNLQYFE